MSTTYRMNSLIFTHEVDPRQGTESVGTEASARPKRTPQARRGAQTTTNIPPTNGMLLPGASGDTRVALEPLDVVVGRRSRFTAGSAHGYPELQGAQFLLKKDSEVHCQSSGYILHFHAHMMC